MTSLAWIGFLLLACGAGAVTLWVYRCREAPGRGRGVLAVLRTVAIVLLLLMLFDPELPARAGGGTASRATLIDGSLSMSMPDQAGATRWSAARSAARAAETRNVIVFGAEPHAVPLDSIATWSPSELRSALLPSLQAAAEAGAARATIITDGALEDADDVVRWLPRLGMEVTVERIGGGGANRGITEVRAPAWAGDGEPIEIQAGIAALGGTGDSVIVSAVLEGRTLAQTTVAVPAEGRVSAAMLRFDAAPPSSGTIARYDITIAGGDAVPDDDARPVYVDVTAEPAGLAFVSFQPDWEPRYLLPVLERALGLPVHGFLRIRPTSWVRIGAGLRGGERVDEAEVQRAIDTAGLVVLHAYGAAAPDWARAAATTARRVMILPASDPGNAPLPVSVGPAVAADWYLSESVPASPIAQHLTGLNTREMPPLPAMHIVDEVSGAWAPAQVSRGRRGVGYPLALAGGTGARRWLVGLGEGYWRWAFRDASSRDVYQRLWSAMGGWLVEDQVVSRDELVPLSRAVPRGQPVRWVAAGASTDSFRVRLTAADGAVTVDTVMMAAGADTLTAPAVAPGHYTYSVRAFAPDGDLTGEGPISVETFSPEFTRPSIDLSQLEGRHVSALSTGPATRRPLRYSPFPWLFVITILCVEWVLRRRWGLR
ncbi:MAG: hypothetical protein L0271_03895 [Gemmatimonadetes bacterium]|nr:hypothetical protein [Gemmatimonadota bacterium]